MKQFILGIETSCDDTAIALLDISNNKIIESLTINQFNIHNKYGGIYPELAAREHLKNILPILDTILRNIDLNEIKYVAVTRGPGLITSLLVGINTALAIGTVLNIPVIGVNHLRAHLRSAELNEQKLVLPALILLVSGGHTILAIIDNDNEIRVIGETRDDSLGETYDKVARMLKLGYPGGPIIDKLAQKGRKIYKFPKPLLKGYEFSFSGLKTAVRRFLEREIDFKIEDVAASFVETIIDLLYYKLSKAIEQFKPASLVIVGGVSASPQIRELAKFLERKYKINLFLPPLKYATDNAAMVAYTAIKDYINNNNFQPPYPSANLSLNEY